MGKPKVVKRDKVSIALLESAVPMVKNGFYYHGGGGGRRKFKQNKRKGL